MIKYINIGEAIRCIEVCQVYLEVNISKNKGLCNICSNGITYSRFINSIAAFYDCNRESEIYSKHLPPISFDHFFTNGSMISFYNTKSSMETTMLIRNIFDNNYKISKKKSEKEFDIISYDC